MDDLTCFFGLFFLVRFTEGNHEWEKGLFMFFTSEYVSEV